MALILQAMIRPDLVSVKSALYLTFIQSTYTLKITLFYLYWR